MCTYLEGTTLICQSDWIMTCRKMCLCTVKRNIILIFFSFLAIIHSSIINPVLDIYDDEKSQKKQALEYETHLQEFAHSDESLLLQKQYGEIQFIITKPIWVYKVKTWTHVQTTFTWCSKLLLVSQKLNDYYWFKMPILVLTHLFSGICGKL